MENFIEFLVKQWLAPVKKVKLFQPWKQWTYPMLEERKGHTKGGLFVQPPAFRAKSTSQVATAAKVYHKRRKRRKVFFQISIKPY
jgi:hypothetical protein